MKYEVFGPFELPRTDGNLLDCQPESKKAFWAEVNGSNPGLSEACGCYVVSVHWVVQYVGLARRQSFEGECFQPHKAVLYSKAMQTRKSPWRLHLLARMTPGGRFAKPSPTHSDIVDLERLLIAYAIERNEDLLNKKDTGFFRDAVVPGIINSPRGEARAAAVQSLKQVLGL